MKDYSASWFVARLGPMGGPPSSYTPTGRIGIWDSPTQRLEVWASSPDLWAADPQIGVAVFLHGDLYGSDSHPGAVRDAYLSEGEGLFEALNGSFAVLIADRRQDLLYVATDRFNSRKVFVSEENGERWFSTTLTRHPTSRRELSPAGIGSLLSNGVAHADLTPFAGVRKLKPASFYTYSGSHEKVEQYWRFNGSGGDHRQEPAEARQHLIKLMRSSVARRLGESGEVFVSFSGGYDSRAVAGFLGEIIVDPGRVRLLTYHHGPPVGDTDAGAAAAAAAQLGFRHQLMEAYRGDLVATIEANSVAGQGIANFCMEVDAWQTIGPTMSANDENVLFVAEIPGMGPTPKGSTPESVLASVSLFPISTIDYFVSQLDPDAGESLRRGWGETFARLLQLASSHRDPRIGQDHLYLDQRLSNTLMLWRECFQMPYVRVANPFLDNDVVDVMLGLPVEYRSQKLLYREALSETFPDLFSIPVSPGGWGAPDWAKEIRSNVGQIRDLLRSPSRLDELIPPSAIIRLLESGLAAPAAKRDDVVAGLKTMVRNSAPLRRLVRTVKPRVKPPVPRRRSWERLMLDLLSLRGFLATTR